MNKHIGHGQRRIKELFSELNKSTPIRVDLIHNKKFQKGFINCSGILVLIPSKGATPPVKMEEKVQVSESKKEPTTKDAPKGGLTFPEKNVPLKLVISSIEAHDLVNVVKSGEIQDPCVQLSIGKKSFSTKR